MSKQDIINVELAVWMQQVHANNTGENYYTIGNVKGKKHTLLVTHTKGNGGAVMFCTQHSFAYPIKGACAECQNAVTNVADDASVTACYTPEIER